MGSCKKQEVCRDMGLFSRKSNISSFDKDKICKLTNEEVIAKLKKEEQDMMNEELTGVFREFGKEELRKDKW